MPAEANLDQTHPQAKAGTFLITRPLYSVSEPVLFSSNEILSVGKFSSSDGRIFGCLPERLLKFSIPYGDTGFIIENFTTANLHA